MRLDYLKHYFLLLATVIVLLALTSCKKQALYDVNKDIPQPWKISESIPFEFEVKDTINPYNFYINIRNTTDYSYSNVFFFLKTDFPDGRFSLDTVEVFLADLDGNWLGKGMGKNKDNQIIFKKRSRFPMSGKYKLSFSHAMRIPDLKGIVSVGFRIEKTQ